MKLRVHETCSLNLIYSVRKSHCNQVYIYLEITTTATVTTRTTNITSRPTLPTTRTTSTKLRALSVAGTFRCSIQVTTTSAIPFLIPESLSISWSMVYKSHTGGTLFDPHRTFWGFYANWTHGQDSPEANLALDTQKKINDLLNE